MVNGIKCPTLFSAGAAIVTTVHRYLCTPDVCIYLIVAGSGNLTLAQGGIPSTPAQSGGVLPSNIHNQCLSCDSHVTSVGL